VFDVLELAKSFDVAPKQARIMNDEDEAEVQEEKKRLEPMTSGKSRTNQVTPKLTPKPLKAFPAVKKEPEVQ
jgi:hypothetical protein